ncbi:ubiquinone biosynthesis protein COQ3, mitochondrial [Nomia melanderi]|uniref:ubiquinone biosynthesis protein COQ3, mitochondrial n=1 Tax=Nomia melanderi TaxID=2448451 RepID=UPI0013040419|nr:ubiquinone biosynthesis O-methyltransferase, mitochondrial [Nomia melanderi]
MMKIPKFVSSRSICTGNVFWNRLTEEIEQSGKSATGKRSTVDVGDVEHHSKLSNTWWDVNGEIRPLHSLNPLRVQFIRDGLANTGTKVETPHSPLNGVKILDIGCGGGLLSEPLARIGAEVTGIDASSELISIAKQHALLDSDLDGKLNYLHTTIEDFCTQNKEKFNAVVASELIEHVNDKELFLKSCVSTLMPGGSIFLTTLNRTLSSWLGGIIAAEYVLKIVPQGIHNWNKFITPIEIQRLLETCGCRTKLLHGIFYNPLKNEWFWTSSTAINYAIHAVKK